MERYTSNSMGKQALNLINENFSSMDEIKAIIKNEQFPDKLNDLILKYQSAKMSLRKTLISSYDFNCISFGEYCKTVNVISRWGLNPTLHTNSRGSSIFDLGIFPLDSLRYLFLNRIDEIYNPEFIHYFNPINHKLFL